MQMRTIKELAFIAHTRPWKHWNVTLRAFQYFSIHTFQRISVETRAHIVYYHCSQNREKPRHAITIDWCKLRLHTELTRKIKNKKNEKSTSTKETTSEIIFFENKIKTSLISRIIFPSLRQPDHPRRKFTGPVRWDFLKALYDVPLWCRFWWSNTVTWFVRSWGHQKRVAEMQGALFRKNSRLEKRTPWRK